MGKKILLILVAIIIIAAGVWAYEHYSKMAQSPAQSASDTQSRTLLSAVTYSCDKGKTISAEYYNGPAAPQPEPGQPPVPTGSVDVSIGGAATTTLAQTISADGTRYANADESLVFWSKGNTALVMRNNSMDLDYTNCAAPAAQ